LNLIYKIKICLILFFAVECGITEINPNVKVVGGEIASTNSWPYQVHVKQNIKYDLNLPDYTKKTIEFSISCGGTLINHFTILTAAHCILTSDTEEFNNETIIHLITPNEYYPTWYTQTQIILKNS
jgi:V8-like Glu-specific endopeptidase